MLNAYARAGLALAGMALAACGDSTAPHAITPAQLARHIDSLASAAWADAQVGRPYFLSQTEGPPGNGAWPVSLAVSTTFGSQTWQGFVLKYAHDTLAFGPQYDSIYVLFAYSNYAMTNLIVAQTTYFHGDVTPLVQAWVLTDTVAITGGRTTNTFETLTSDPGCHLISGLKNYGAVGRYSTCNLGTFNVGVSWFLPQAPPGFEAVTIVPQHVNGIVLH